MAHDDEDGAARPGSEPPAPAGSWSELLSDPNRTAAIALAAGVGLHAVNLYLAATILPSVTADIGGLSLYAWTTTLFVFAAVIGSTATPALLAASGPRRAYRLAAGILALGTTACTLAPSMPALVAGRAVQGLGGGLLFALAYSTVRLALAPALWSRAMALMSAMFGVATIVGPALGGLFAELGAWRLSFGVFVPLTAWFAWAGTARLPGTTEGARPTRLPVLGVAILAVAVLAVSAASISSRVAVNALGLLAAFACLAVWLRRERGAVARLLPADTFVHGSRIPWLYATMALLMVATAVDVFVPYFGQRLQDLGPLAAGYLGAAMSVGWTAATMLFSNAGRRQVTVMRVAPLVSTLGLVVLLLVAPTASSDGDVLLGVVVGLLLLGAGIGMGWPYLLSAVLAATSDRDREVAGSSLTTVQMVAQAFGAASAGLIVNLAGFTDPGGTAGTSDAAHWLFLAMLPLPLLAALTVRVATRPGRADVVPATERA